MEVEIRYVGEYAEAAGTRREVIDVHDEAALEDVVKLLIGQHGERFSKAIFDPTGELDCRLSMGEINADSLDDLDFQITGDPIVFLRFTPPTGT